MIKIEDSEFIVKGNIAEVEAEITVLINYFKEILISAGNSPEEADNILDKMLKMSKLTDEELKSEVMKIMIKKSFGKDFI